jgi:hypothetical protein
MPLALWTGLRGRHRTLKGVWIAAGITALVNATCAGLVVASIGGRG